MAHRIQKQILELDIPSGGDSWRFQNELRDTFNQRVLPRLEKVCDELGIGEDTIIKIDSLLLDTGTINSHGLSNEWVNAIEYQFKEQIKRIKHQGASQAEKVEIQTNEESTLRLVLHYLNLGILPWWAQQQEPVQMKSLLNELIEKNPQALLSGLKRKPNLEIAIRRLLTNIEAPQIKTLYSTLGINHPLKEQLADWFRAAELRQFSGSLQSLEVVELMVKLKNPEVKSEQVIHQWMASEIQHNTRFKEVITNEFKHLIDSDLKSKTKVSIKENTQEVLLAVFTRLEKENLLNETASDSNSTKAGTEHPNRKLSQPETQNETNGSEQSSLSKPHEKSPQTRSIKGDKTDAHQEEIAPLGQASESYVPSNSGDDNTAGSERPHSPATSPDEVHQTSTGLNEKSPLSAEDAHVYQQLERIRQAAKEKEDKFKGSTPGVKIEDTHKAVPSDPEASKKGDEFTKAESVQKYDSLKKDKDILKKEEVITTKADSIAPVENRPKEAVTPPTYDLSRIEEVEECYIENAGLVLFWPFLSRFFSNIGLMHEGAFKSISHQEQAAVTLQHLLGEAPNLEEFALPLNKILCALPIEHPLGETDAISEKEKALCQELIQSTIANWNSLKGTSVPGFQGSFLNRQGVLKKQENGWLLQVEKMAFDMLLEQLPWPVSIVKLSWMEKPIYVEW